MEIIHIVGARPNFPKLAPVYKALAAKPNVQQTVIHTGQHYDDNMSGVFFRAFGLPAPEINLAVGSMRYSQQIAAIMQKLEPIIAERKPDWVVVYGDVNSTVGAAIVCAGLQQPFAHVEAGLRSFDRTMPEEINRLLTDSVADLLLTPSEDANQNLNREGVAPEKIVMVGNVMIDTLLAFLPLAQKTDISRFPTEFVLVTLHRPSNVDVPTRLTAIVEALVAVGQRLPVVFPVHPRTAKLLPKLPDNIVLTEPLDYFTFLHLQSKAKIVLTDSGGVQEETTFLQIPCLTLRQNTERPITCTLGTNRLTEPEQVPGLVHQLLDGTLVVTGSCPPRWDGKTGERIADCLLSAR